ncbi:MAG: hypothetical protein AAGI37_06960 [Planctomycetota bacterium]
MAVNIVGGQLGFEHGPDAIQTVGARTLSGPYSPDTILTGNGTATVEATEDLTSEMKLALKLRAPTSSDGAVVRYGMSSITAGNSQDDKVTTVDNFYKVIPMVFGGIDIGAPDNGRLALYRLLGGASGTTNIVTLGVQRLNTPGQWRLFARFPMTGQASDASDPSGYGTTAIPVREKFEVLVVWRRAVGVYIYTRLAGETVWTLQVSRENADVNEVVNRDQYMLDYVSGTWTGTFNTRAEFFPATWSSVSQEAAEEPYLHQKFAIPLIGPMGQLTFQLTQNPDAYQNTSGTSLDHFAVEYAYDSGFTGSMTTAWTQLPGVASHYTARIDVTGLTPGARLYYRWVLRSTSTGVPEYAGDTRSLLVPGPDPNLCVLSCIDHAGQLADKPQLRKALEEVVNLAISIAIITDDPMYSQGMSAEDDGKFLPESEREILARWVEAFQSVDFARFVHSVAIAMKEGDHSNGWNDYDLTQRETTTGTVHSNGFSSYADPASTFTPAQVAAAYGSVSDSIHRTAMRANWFEASGDYGVNTYGGTKVVLTNSWEYRRLSTNTGWGATQLAWFKSVVDSATEDLVFCIDQSVWGRIGSQGSSLINIATAEHLDAIDYVHNNGAQGTKYIGVGGDSHIGATGHRRASLSTGDIIVEPGATRGWVAFLIACPVDQKNNAQLNTGTDAATYAASTGTALREGVDAHYPYREAGRAQPSTDPISGAVLDPERGQLRTSGVFITTSSTGIRARAWGDDGNVPLVDQTYEYTIGYKLYRRTSQSGTDQLVATLSDSTLSYTLTGLLADTEAWYYVNAVSPCGVESTIKPASRMRRVAMDATNQLIAPAPNAPHGVKLDRGPGGLVTLFWQHTNDNGEIDAASFHVYVATGADAFDFNTPTHTINLPARSVGLGTFADSTTVRVVVRAVTSGSVEETNTNETTTTADAAAPVPPASITLV